jgi:hypothetical protein
MKNRRHDDPPSSCPYRIGAEVEIRRRVRGRSSREDGGVKLPAVGAPMGAPTPELRFSSAVALSQRKALDACPQAGAP